MTVVRTIPHNFEPRAYQRPVFKALQSGVKRAILCWHRRAGKDKACLNLMIRLIAEQEARGIAGVYYYLFPTFAQGRKALWDAIDKDGFRFIDHFPKDFVRRVNASDMQITTRNGSVFQIIGTDHIDALMGTNPLGCVFSEYALQRPDAWELLRPILAENGGWAVFNFTPRGRNHAWRLLQLAKDDPDWFSQVLTANDTDAISSATLKRERKEMPQDLFEQEYLCVFTDGAGQFFKNVEACIWEGDMNPVEGGRYHAGADLAKVRDWTVLTAIDLATFRVAKQVRFNQLDYTVQKDLIRRFYERWNRPAFYIDKTGVGEPVCDDLRASGVRNLRPVHFTEQTKRTLLLNLQLLLEQQTIRIPNDELLLDELRAFRYELDEDGQTKIVGTPGVHSDMVMSLALAVFELPQRPLRKNEEDTTGLADLAQFDAHKGKSRNQVLHLLRRRGG